MKKADNVVFNYETDTYDAHLKEYPTSFNSKNFSIDKLKDLKNVAQPYFKSKLLEVQLKYEKLKQELSWNQRIYNAKCNFNPIIGEKYYLYKDKNKEFLREACKKFKSQIALGLDAKDGNLSVSGWKENLNIKTIDFLKEVNSYGVSRIIYTDINRDGMKTSPNLDETVKIAELSNCPVVISGGVSSINDIKKAKDLNNNKIEGIIVGKAIYDGDIKLDELAKEISA